MAQQSSPVGYIYLILRKFMGKEINISYKIIFLSLDDLDDSP